MRSSSAGSHRRTGRRWPVTPDKIQLQIMAPARGLYDWPRSSVRFVEVVVSAIGVGLEYPRIGRQMPVRMHAFPVG